MKIILLGYNGLIGRNILELLVKKINKSNKFNLICVGRKINTQPFKNKKIKYIKWNFTEFSKPKLYFLKKNCIIINCIGKTDSDMKNLKNLNFPGRNPRFSGTRNPILRVLGPKKAKFGQFRAPQKIIE